MPPTRRKLMSKAITRLVAAAAAAASCAAVQAQPLQTCYQSKWGANDQIGALNNITVQNVQAAAKLVKRGKAIRMGIETNSKTPAFPPRTFALTILQPGQEYGGSLGDTKTNYNDDIIMGWTGTGSQLDGLGHIGIDGVYYNCAKGREFVTAAGLKKYGIETVPAIATRAVILDMVGLTGQDPVKEGTAFNRKEIDAALKRQGGMKIGKGDVVVFYTGWTKLIGKDDKRYGSVEPGLGVDGANYLASLAVAMVGSDTWGVEVVPFEDPKKIFYVHQILIAQNGIMILENVNAEEAVKDKVYEGLFTLGPSRVTGAVQAIINPIFLY
jgi:kynurenine formamidase